MSDWINHVKKYAKDHNVSYKDAMSKAKSSYTKKSPMKGKGLKNIDTVKRKLPPKPSKPMKLEKMRLGDLGNLEMEGGVSLAGVVSGVKKGVDFAVKNRKLIGKALELGGDIASGVTGKSGFKTASNIGKLIGGAKKPRKPRAKKEKMFPMPKGKKAMDQLNGTPLLPSLIQKPLLNTAVLFQR